MKRINANVYKCDYCSKVSLSSAGTSRHERYCKKNPLNNPKCFQGCNYLNYVKRQYTGDEIIPTQFYCKRYPEKLLFGHKAELNYLTMNYLEEFADNNGYELMPMPLECDLYEDNADFDW